jgi:competence protein ComEC
VIDGLLLLTGVLVGLGSAALPSLTWMIMAGVSAMLVLVTPLRRCAVPAGAALLLVGLGVAWGSTWHWLSLRVPASAEGRRVLLEGRILSVPAREGAEVHFDVTGTLVDDPDTRVRTARLMWRSAPYAPRAGERWRLLVRLAQLSETRNFAGADPARFMFRDRVHLSGRVLPSRLNLRLALANASIDSARARVAARIDDQVADPDAAALLVALAGGAHRSAERGSMARVQCDWHDASRRHLGVAHHAVRVDCLLRRTSGVEMAAGAARGHTSSNASLSP